MTKLFFETHKRNGAFSFKFFSPQNLISSASPNSNSSILLNITLHHVISGLPRVYNNDSGDVISPDLNPPLSLCC